jgi:hypothetical protein
MGDRGADGIVLVTARPSVPERGTGANQRAWPIKDEAYRWEPIEPWARPLAGVRIEGKHLRLEYSKPYVEGRSTLELAPRTDFRMIKEFADLSFGDCAVDGRLISFATRYGGLGLCKEHGWPLAHKKPYCPTDGSETRDGHIYRENLRAWRVFSHVARAIVTVLVAPRGATRDAELAVLKKGGDSDADQAIARWLAGGELKLRFLSSPTRLTLYGVPPLWTALGLELAAMSVGAKAVILCSACSRLDVVKRPRRNDNRRTYCAQCRDSGRKRDAVADLRQRQQQARKLRAQHMSVKEIAAQLGIGTDRVRSYLNKEKDNA